jgi:hypothetical protein
LDIQTKSWPYHNACRVLSDIYDEYFTLKQIGKNTYFKVIPAGALSLDSYNTGLCWIKVYTELRPGSLGRSITVLVGNIDDGFWRAYTQSIVSDTESENCLERIKQIVSSIQSLPTESELISILSIAALPHTLTTCFD